MKKFITLFLVILVIGVTFSYAAIPSEIELSRSIQMVLYLSDSGVCNTSVLYIVFPEGTYSTMEEAADHSPEAASVRTMPEPYDYFFNHTVKFGMFTNATEIVGIAGTECYYYCGFDAAMPHCKIACHDRNYTYYIVHVYKNNEDLGDSKELEIVFNDTIDVARVLIPVMDKCEAPPNNLPIEPTPELDDIEKIKSETAEIISNAAQAVADAENGVYIENAEVALARASEAFDLGEYEIAKIYAENAVIFANAANMEMSDSTENLMNDAAAAINDATEEIMTAKLNGTDVAQAEELLAGASSSFSSGDYANAEALANNAASSIEPDNNVLEPEQQEDLRELFFEVISKGSVFLIILLLLAVVAYYLWRRGKKK